MTPTEQAVLRAGQHQPFWRVLRSALDGIVHGIEQESFVEDDVLAANMQARGARRLRDTLLGMVEREADTKSRIDSEE